MMDKLAQWPILDLNNVFCFQIDFTDLVHFKKTIGSPTCCIHLKIGLYSAEAIKANTCKILTRNKNKPKIGLYKLHCQFLNSGSKNRVLLRGSVLIPTEMFINPNFDSFVIIFKLKQ